MWCDGARQESVFRACTHRDSSSSSTTSRPMARGVPVAAATSSSNGSSSEGVGGGAVHVVPSGSSHGSFTDLPFLINPWVSNQLRRLVSIRLCTAAPHAVKHVVMELVEAVSVHIRASFMAASLV